MSQPFGKLLDEDDKSRSEDEERFKINGEPDLGALRRQTLGQLPTRMLDSGPSTLFFGPQAKLASETLTPFLYFNKTIAIELCAGCPQVRDPSLIRPFLERGTLIVFMVTPYSNTSSDFQRMVSEYPEYFVGANCYREYRYLAFNPIDSRHPDKHRHYDAGRIQNTLESCSEELPKLSPDFREKLDDIVGGIRSLPPDAAAAQFADRYTEVVNHPSDSSIAEIGSAVALSYYAFAVKALGVSGQLNQNYLGQFDLLTNGLRINVPESADSRHYLDLACSYRGVLPQQLVSSNASKVLEKVREINSEIEKLESSKRLKYGVLATRTLRWLPSITATLVARSSFKVEGEIGPPIRTGSPRSSTGSLTARILSRYFGVDKMSVQVWQIRKSLAKKDPK